MKNFKDFNITPNIPSFVGQKINILAVLNFEIEVYDYKVEPSKYNPNKPCLHLQIKFEDNKRVIFVGSKSLIADIEQIPKSELPFKAIIRKEENRYRFT